MHISSSYAKILGETNFHKREIPRSGSKAKNGEEMAVKSRKTSEKSPFFLKKIKFTQNKYFFCIYLLVMHKKLGEQLFRTWDIPRSGSKAKDGEKVRNTPGTAGGRG